MFTTLGQVLYLSQQKIKEYIFEWFALTMCSLQAALFEYMMDLSLAQARGHVRRASVYATTAPTRLLSLNKAFPSAFNSCAFSFNSYNITILVSVLRRRNTSVTFHSTLCIVEPPPFQVILLASYLYVKAPALLFRLFYPTKYSKNFTSFIHDCLGRTLIGRPI